MGEYKGGGQSQVVIGFLRNIGMDPLESLSTQFTLIYQSTKLFWSTTFSEFLLDKWFVSKPIKVKASHDLISLTAHLNCVTSINCAYWDKS